MKKLLLPLALASSFFLMLPTANASEYGCKVLLCLANPASNGGPRGVSECIPPINQLFDDLKHGRAFPTCGMSDGNDGSSYAKLVNDPYDPCPDGLTPAAQGSYVAQGSLKQGPTGQQGISEATIDDFRKFGPRACVGSPVGPYTIGDRDDQTIINLFRKVVWQQPQNPNAIDVYIDGKLHQRVRW